MCILSSFQGIYSLGEYTTNTKYGLMSSYTHKEFEGFTNKILVSSSVLFLMRTKYTRGREKEYWLVKQLKEQGYDIVIRSAGSHSPVDVWAVDISNKKIKLFQCKKHEGCSMDYIEPALKEQLEKENNKLNGLYEVEFEAV